jgi:hypothetical protein
MGNRPKDEEGSFFRISEGLGKIYCGGNTIGIIEEYGCSIVDGERIFGTMHSGQMYLFVPKNVYPIMKTMFESMHIATKKEELYWKEYHEKKKEEESKKLNEISQFIDPKIPIEV